MVRMIEQITGVSCLVDESRVEEYLANGFTYEGSAPKAAKSKPPAEGPVEVEKPDVDGMTIAELASWCKSNGVKAAKGWKRADYINAIDAL